MSKLSHPSYFWRSRSAIKQQPSQRCRRCPAWIHRRRCQSHGGCCSKCLTIRDWPSHQHEDVRLGLPKHGGAWYKGPTRLWNRRTPFVQMQINHPSTPLGPRSPSPCSLHRWFRRPREGPRQHDAGAGNLGHPRTPCDDGSGIGLMPPWALPGFAAVYQDTCRGVPIYGAREPLTLKSAAGCGTKAR